jgi:hypothetical protein
METSWGDRIITGPAFGVMLRACDKIRRESSRKPLFRLLIGADIPQPRGEEWVEPANKRDGPVDVTIVEHDDLASRRAAHHQGQKRGGTDGTRSDNCDSHNRSPFARPVR